MPTPVFFALAIEPLALLARHVAEIKEAEIAGMENKISSLLIN